MNIFYAAIMCMCILAIPVHAQLNQLIQNEEFIFWQPGYEIRHSDYLDTTQGQNKQVEERYNAGFNKNIVIKCVVDIPKKKKDKGAKPERAYFAPVFCKNCSALTSEDTTMFIKHDRIFLDLAELCTRKARKELESICQIIPAYGVKTIFTPTLTEEATDLLSNLVNAYAKEVILDKKEGAYEEWNKIIGELLRESSDYATTTEDCLRFIRKGAIEPDYEPATFIVADLRRKKESQDTERKTSAKVKRAREFISNLNIPNDNLSLTELRNLNVQKVNKTSSGHVIKSEFFQKGAIKNIISTMENEGIVLFAVKGSPVNHCVLLNKICYPKKVKDRKETTRYAYFRKNMKSGKLQKIPEKHIITIYYVNR